MPRKQKSPATKRETASTRLKTDLPFEEAVKRLLNTPPPPKDAHPPRQSKNSDDESRSE